MCIACMPQVIPNKRVHFMQMLARATPEDYFRVAISEGQGPLEPAFEAAGMPLEWCGPVCQVAGERTA